MERKKKPTPAGFRSLKLETDPGTYSWCACGRSKNQPFCDGSHQGTAFRPVSVTINEKKLVKWCLCKQTKTPPFCDHSHRELPGYQLEGKYCMVTGASSGIGKAVVLLLLRNGANVIMVSRNRERGRRFFERVHEMYPKKTDWIPADLSSVNSVKGLVEEFTSRYEKLHYLFDCAGELIAEKTFTPDGFDRHLASNYLGHFLLVHLLRKSLMNGAPSRVIIVSGRQHKPGIFAGGELLPDKENLTGKRKLSFVKSSRQAVLAKIMFTYELARRWAGTGIEVCTVCPGLTRTHLTDHAPWFIQILAKAAYVVRRSQSPESAANHLIRLALMDNVNGKYFEGSVNGLHEAQSSDESYDAAKAERLWNETEKLLHLDEE